ncbi:MAG: TetR/AcrR family transcriptional regulator [Pseudomonadota bacterium]
MGELKSKLGRKATETRERVLDAAEAIILAKSFGSVGINEVLAASGIPKGSFYHYFASKEDFGVKLIERHAAIYGRELDRLLANDAPDARQQLLWFLRFHIDYYTKNTCVLDCLIVKLSSEVSTMSETLRQTVSKVTHDWTEKFVALVARGHADGSIAPELDAGKTGAFLYASWLGANTQVAVTKSVAPFEGLLHTLDSLLDGPHSHGGGGPAGT